MFMSRDGFSFLKKKVYDYRDAKASIIINPSILFSKGDIRPSFRVPLIKCMNAKKEAENQK